MVVVLLKRIECKRCLFELFICRSCWRGQAYCSQACRQAAQKESHCIAQQKYRQTEKGKEAHRQQEKRRRLRNSKKTVDDASSTPGLAHDNVCANLLFTTPCCSFCGKTGQVIDHFPRQGYGRRYENIDLPSTYLHGG
jgi:hypothetical protein